MSQKITITTVTLKKATGFIEGRLLNPHSLRFTFVDDQPTSLSYIHNVFCSINFQCCCCSNIGIRLLICRRKTSSHVNWLVNTIQEQ